MRNLLVSLAALALAVSACGGSADDADSAPATTSVPATTAAPATAAAPATTTTEASTATTTTAAATLIPSGDPDIDAVVTAFTVAFDSTTNYEAKLPYVDDLSGLEDTVVKYMETGESMGGVSILVSEVVVDGDEASIVYDLLFNGNPIYPNLPGTALLNDAGWQVPRAEFCIMMSNARVGCPAE